MTPVAGQKFSKKSTNATGKITDRINSSGELFSEKCKVLVFLLVWSFNSHALNILSADDLGEFSGIL